MSVAPVPRIEPFGDSAVLVTCADELDLGANDRAQRLAAAIVAWHEDAAREAVPFGPPVAGHVSVLVPYDPAILDSGAAVAAVEKAVAAVDTAVAAGGNSVAYAATGFGANGFGAPGPSPGPADDAVIDIPVRYGGRDGPDLEEVARRLGMTEDEVVGLHAGGVYRILLLGFAPGFAYLGLLPPELATARRATPRPRVPAGSVAIAGRQTAVYPLETPGGWNILGRTEFRPWDVSSDPPNRFAPGRLVRFRPVAGS